MVLPSAFAHPRRGRACREHTTNSSPPNPAGSGVRLRRDLDWPETAELLRRSADSPAQRPARRAGSPATAAAIRHRIPGSGPPMPLQWICPAPRRSADQERLSFRPYDEKPNGRPAERSQLRLPAAPAQFSRPASVTGAVSDRWSAKNLNERGLSVTPCHAGDDAPPGRPRRPACHGQRPSAGLGPWQSPGFGPPTCRLRQLALERSHYAQYRSDRLCPVVADGLRQIPIGAGGGRIRRLTQAFLAGDGG